MRNTFNTLLILLSVTLGGIPIAYAACMDDAGDALAAFFSGGVSYATCQMIETVQSMIRTVQTIVGSMERMTRDTISTAQRMVNESADTVINNTNNAMRQLDAMKNESRQLANNAVNNARPAATLPTATPAKPAGAPTRINTAGGKSGGPTPRPETAVQLAAPVAGQGLNTRPVISQQASATLAAGSQPAASGDIQQAMRQAADTMGRIHSELASQTVNHIMNAANQAKNQALRHADAARRIAETSVMAPLRQLEEMLQDLVRHPARIFDPSSLVNESVERLTRAMTQVTEQIHHEIMNESLATLRDINGEISRLTGDIGKAERIHNALVNLDRRRDQQSLNALKSLLADSNPPTNLSGLRLAGSLRIMPNLQQSKDSSTRQSSRAMQPLIASLNRDFNSFKNVKLQTSKNMLPASVEQRARAELDKLLRNKDQAEADRIKNQIKAQVRNKLASNSTALAEVDRQFDERFARILPQTTQLRPVPGVKPVVVQPLRIQ